MNTLKYRPKKYYTFFLKFMFRSDPTLENYTDFKKQINKFISLFAQNT